MSIDITSGGIDNIGTASPSTVLLNLLSLGMNSNMSAVTLYYQNHNNHCPPVDYFLRKPNHGLDPIAYITNDSKCGVLAQFSQNAPGVLQNQYVRIVPKMAGSDTSAVDFAYQQTITSVDFGSNGIDSNFFLRPQRAFAWSPSLLSSVFGRAASASVQDVLNTTYDQISQQSTAANSSSTSSGSSAAGPTRTSSINSV